jgi:starch-binding outer membrane protein, SusD/RagB family
MIMKNKIFISIAFLMLFSISCTKDFLQLEPKTSLLEANFYKTETDALLGLVSVYDALSVQNWQFVPLMADIRSDDTHVGGDNSGNDMLQWQQMEKFQIDGDNAAVEALWSRCYSGIYRANQLLGKLDVIQWTSEATKKRIEAEAKFLRAYFYWDLARHYGWAPILTSVISDIDALTKVPQSTPSEVYKQIATDLLDALPGLPNSVTAQETGRASKMVAKALIARIYLYYEGFVKPVLGVTDNWSNGTTTIDKAYATSALEDIISSGQFELLDSYADVFDWSNQNNKEMVFSWQYHDASGATDWGGWGINGNFSVIFQGPRDAVGDPEITNGWSFNVLSFSLVNSFETGDPRKAVTAYNANARLTSYTKGFQNTGYFNYKFIPRTAYIAAKGDPSHNFPANYPDIRYADVLLMAAELHLGTNNAKALSYFNQVRERALGAGTGKIAITIDDIYSERRVEFGGEGHRYFDLLRRGLSYAETMINASFSNIPTGVDKVNPADFALRAFNPQTYGMFPIPAADIRNTGNNLKNFIPAYQ